MAIYTEQTKQGKIQRLFVDNEEAFVRMELDTPFLYSHWICVNPKYNTSQMYEELKKLML